MREQNGWTSFSKREVLSIGRRNQHRWQSSFLIETFFLTKHSNGMVSYMQGETLTQPWAWIMFALRMGYEIIPGMNCGLYVYDREGDIISSNFVYE